MPQMDVLNWKKEVVGKVDLAPWWDDPGSDALMHQAAVAAMAGCRRGTHATKGRSDVSGGGKKPFRQKGLLFMEAHKMRVRIDKVPEDRITEKIKDARDEIQLRRWMVRNQEERQGHRPYTDNMMVHVVDSCLAGHTFDISDPAEVFFEIVRYFKHKCNWEQAIPKGLRLRPPSL